MIAPNAIVPRMTQKKPTIARNFLLNLRPRNSGTVTSLIRLNTGNIKMPAKANPIMPVHSCQMIEIPSR